MVFRVSGLAQLKIEDVKTLTFEHHAGTTVEG